MGGVLYEEINIARKNIGRAKEADPMGGPHLGKGAGHMEYPLCAHIDLARHGKLRRVPTNCQGEAVTGEELVSRDEVFTGRGKGGRMMRDQTTTPL